MRLFEYEGSLPDLRQFVTNDLIQDIIDIERWVHHGSELEDWLAMSCYATDNAKAIGLTPEEAQELETMPYEEHLHHPNFKKCLEHYVNYAVNHFDGILRHGDPYEKLPPFGPNMSLYRCMVVDQTWLDNPAPNFGTYWSAVPAQARRFLAARQTNVIMQVEVRNVRIDWYETLRSRIDYSSGFDEHEFQLPKGSPIKDVNVTVLNTGEKMIKSGRA